MFLDVLDAVEATSSRTEKEKLLRSTIDDPHIKQVFSYALDPYRTFFIAKIKPPSKGVRKLSSAHPLDNVLDSLVSLGFVKVEQNSEARFDELFKLLDRLTARELSGNAARTALNDMLEAMTEQEQRWAVRVVTKKLRCGVSDETVEKLWPGLVPRFSIQLAETVQFTVAQQVEDLRPITPLQYPLYADVKLDGLRCVALIHDDKTIELRSRKGQLFEDFPSIEAALKNSTFTDVVLDCEVLGEHWDETQSIAFSTKNKKDDSNLRLNVFDALPMSAWIAKQSAMRYVDRLNYVRRFVETLNNPKVVTVPGRTIESEADLLAFFVESVDAGYEGIMLKKLDAVYCFDRSWAVAKCKPTSTHEGKIAGFFEGKTGGKRAGKLGGLLVKLPNNVITRVGGGLKDAQLAEFWSCGEAAMRGQIVECKAQFLTKDGKMRFPRFVRFRNPADVAVEVCAIEV